MPGWVCVVARVGNRLTGSTTQGGRHGILCVLRYPNGRQCSVLSQLREGRGSGQRCRRVAPAPAQPRPASSYGSTGAPAAPMEENVAGMLAYFTIIPAIIFLLIEPYNRNRFVRFHSFQCLFTCAALIVLHICLVVPQLRSAADDVPHLGAAGTR